MKQTNKEKIMPKVTQEEYFNLLKKTRELEDEVSSYRQKTPLVGIRWYGLGGNSISLSNPVNGINRVILEGKSGRDEDKKAVIDYGTWMRLKRMDKKVEDGLIVRDDNVIDELQVAGKIAPVDNTKSSNSFTDKEILKLFSGSVTPLRKIVDKMTSHWGPIHFIRVAEEHSIKDKAKLGILIERRNYLFAKDKLYRLNIHDLRLCCEQHRIQCENMNVKEMVNELLEIELQFINDSEFS
jgi:hypothetical protein